MQEKHLFEYAVIRIVPRVEREEFLNVGVVLYCADEKFLQMKFELMANLIRCYCCVRVIYVDAVKDSGPAKGEQMPTLN